MDSLPDGDAEVYFLAELAGKSLSIDAAFRVEGLLPELWDPVDGSIREASTYSCAGGVTRLPFELSAYDSLFVVFRKSSPATERNTGPNSPTWQEAQVIAGPWDVAFDSKWGGPAKPVRFDNLSDWTKHEDPAIRSTPAKPSTGPASHSPLTSQASRSHSNSARSRMSGWRG